MPHPEEDENDDWSLEDNYWMNHDDIGGFVLIYDKEDYAHSDIRLRNIRI